MMSMFSDAFHAGPKFLILIVDAAFRSLLLGCFLAAVLAVFRVRTLQAKLLIWRGVLLVALAMPVLILLSPSLPLPVPVPSFSRVAVPAAIPASDPMPAYTSMQTSLREDVRMSPRPNSAAQETVLQRPQTPVPGYPLPRATQMIWWPLAALCLYLCVSSFFFARVLIGLYFARRLHLRSQMIDGADAQRRLAAASETCGLGRPPLLGECSLLAVPVSMGIRRPTVLLPASWRNWETDELSAVLAHEVSHVARHDSLIKLLSLFHRAIFWFSPLSWWIDRHLADLAEQASDEAALEGGANRARYARALVGFLADLDAAPSRVWWHGVAMAKAGQGEKRVDRILSWRSSMPRGIRKSLIVLFAVIGLPAVVISVAAHPSVYTSQDAEVPPSSAPPPLQQLLPPLGAIPAMPAAPIAAPVVPPVVPSAPPATAQPVPAVPPQVEVVAPAPQQPPQTSAPDAAPPAPSAPPAPDAFEPPSVYWGGNWPGFGPMGNFYWPWGPRFVIVTHGSDQLIVSGSQDDAERARDLRSEISGDFIWFERSDGKSYIIRDQAVIARARQIWAQRGDSTKLQQELQARQQQLTKQMREQVQARMEEIRVKIPDMTAELQKLQSEVKDLNADGATLEQLGNLQQQVGELQQALGQARWNSNVQEITRRAGDLGRQMGELGRQIGEIARREAAQERQASERMRQLLDDAIARGLAKPE